MPNWVKNKVKFADNSTLKQLLTKNDDGDYNFDFNKVIEMPATLDIISGNLEDESVQYAFSKMGLEQKIETKKLLESTKIDFNSNYYNKIFRYKKYNDEELFILNEEFKLRLKETKKNYNKRFKKFGVKNLYDLGMIYINNVKKYGFSTWYEWSCKNWGTKWNACHTIWDGEDNYVEFETAWVCPFPIFKEISKKYHTSLIVEYADEDIGSNCGEITFTDGVNSVIDMSDDRDFAYNVWNYTKEEIEEFECED